MLVRQADALARGVEMEYGKRQIQLNGAPSPPRAFKTAVRIAWLAIAGCIAADFANHLLEDGTPSGQITWSPLFAQDEAPNAADKALLNDDKVVAYRFDVPLPITGKAVAKRVEQVLRKLPRGGPRPVFIFDFRPPSGTSGEGSSFGDAYNLAEYISGDKVAAVKTVAWVRGTVKGHAVLPILACEQIVVAKDAELGAAGIDEKTINDALRSAYTEIVKRRRDASHAIIAQGFLDKELAVFKVTLLENKASRYETAEELQQLRARGAVSDVKTLFEAGDQHLLSAQEMRAAALASHIADDRDALATALQLPRAALQQDLAPEEGWRPIRVDLHGPVHQQAVNWIVRSLEDHHRRGDFNLLVFSLNSGGGDLEQSRRLAAHLADLSRSVHIVAFVDRQARSDAALVALACDELVMLPDASLGGPGESILSRDELRAAREAVPEIFETLGRDWSLPMALIDPEIQVNRYHHSLGDDIRYLSAEEYQELADFDQWKLDRPIETSRGLTGEEAEELGLAKATVQSLDELKSLYQLEGDLAQVRPNWALAFVEWLSDPRIAGVLLFVGWFALMFELSTPGVGAPGFVAIICFLLYFWSQFLHGTAGWLEVILFVGGLMCLSVEIFILPGMGVFGVGGALMVIVSIVLASQTFIVPTNAYQLRQFPVSLLMVAAGMAGGIASIYVIRRFLPDTPFFNRMMLAPPPPEERQALSRREALVTWDHLLHKRGTTLTPLVPAGKVQFGDELVDCVSNGELIAKGTPVVVEEVSGNHVVVRKVNT
jgi:membrane-bound ClpP family serine protease